MIINPRFFIKKKLSYDQIETIIATESQKAEICLSKNIEDTLEPEQIKKFCEFKDVTPEDVTIAGEIKGFLLSGIDILVKTKKIVNKIARKFHMQPKDFAYYSQSIEGGLKDTFFFIPGKDLINLPTTIPK